MEKSQPTERDIQDKILKYLKKDLRKGLWFKIPQTGYSLLGVSDILGCFCGHFFALEVKRPGNKPTPMQTWFIKTVRENGGTAEIVYSVEDVKEVLNNATPCTCLSENRLERHTDSPEEKDSEN